MDEQQNARPWHEHPCERLIRLEAQMEAMEKWRDEVKERLEALGSSIDKLLVLALTTLLSIVAGLLYIILNHALLP